MWPTPQMRCCTAALLLAGASLSVAGVGCGSDDFANDPRPPKRVAFTGVITERTVTISPDSTGAGPVLITISNQDDEPHTVTLEGEDVRERVGPVQPMDTATIRKTLSPGTYEVRAGSSKAVAREIEPAVITVGAERPNSNNEILQP